MVYLALLYLNHEPSNIYRFFHHVRYDPALMDVCLKNEEILDKIFNHLVSPQEPLSQAADLVSDISLYASKESRTLLYGRLTPALLKRKLDDSDDIAALAYFIEGLCWDAKAGWQEAIET